MYLKENLDYETLEPTISDETLYVHYNKHYLNYLKNLNNLLGNANYDKVYLAKNIDVIPLEKRNNVLYNLGGVLNHELYFKILGGNGIPNGEILKKINEDFGSFENFQKELIEKSKKVVGSGYTFLVLKNNKLEIMLLSNQETPYSYGYTPIIALDLWEHAYYLDYLNNRNTYVENILKIIDYNKVNEIYKKAKETN